MPRRFCTPRNESPACRSAVEIRNVRRASMSSVRRARARRRASPGRRAPSTCARLADLRGRSGRRRRRRACGRAVAARRCRGRRAAAGRWRGSRSSCAGTGRGHGSATDASRAPSWSTSHRPITAANRRRGSCSSRSFRIRSGSPRSSIPTRPSLRRGSSCHAVTLRSPTCDIRWTGGRARLRKELRGRGSNPQAFRLTADCSAS